MAIFRGQGSIYGYSSPFLLPPGIAGADSPLQHSGFWLPTCLRGLEGRHAQELRRTDEIADLRFSDAKDVAIHDRLTKEIAPASSAQQSVGAELGAIAARSKDLRRRWQREWNSLGAAPLSPAEMKDWVVRRQKILGKLEQRRSKEKDLQPRRPKMDRRSSSGDRAVFTSANSCGGAAARHGFLPREAPGTCPDTASELFSRLTLGGSGITHKNRSRHFRDLPATRTSPAAPCPAGKLQVIFRANSSARIVKLNRPRSWFARPLVSRTDCSSSTRRLRMCVTNLKSAQECDSSLGLALPRAGKYA
jgi:hypothetical protein